MFIFARIKKIISQKRYCKILDLPKSLVLVARVLFPTTTFLIIKVEEESEEGSGSSDSSGSESDSEQEQKPPPKKVSKEH